MQSACPLYSKASVVSVNVALQVWATKEEQLSRDRTWRATLFTCHARIFFNLSCQAAQWPTSVATTGCGAHTTQSIWSFDNLKKDAWTCCKLTSFSLMKAKSSYLLIWFLQIPPLSDKCYKKLLAGLCGEGQWPRQRETLFCVVRRICITQELLHRLWAEKRRNVELKSIQWRQWILCVHRQTPYRRIHILYIHTHINLQYVTAHACTIQTNK